MELQGLLNRVFDEPNRALRIAGGAGSGLDADTLDGLSSGDFEPYIGAYGDLLTTGEEVFERDFVTLQNLPLTSQDLRLTYFTARKTGTIANLRISSGSTAAAATPTLCRVGIYQEAANGDLTLVAAIANDTSLFATINTAYTRALTASFTKTRGVRYAMGVLVVSATTMPFMAGGNLAGGAGADESAIAPRLTGQVSGQADLPASIASGSLGLSGRRIYGVLLP